MNVQHVRSAIEDQPIAPQILASIRQQKAQHCPPPAIEKSLLDKIWEFFFGQAPELSAKAKKLQELRKPSGFQQLKQKPTLAHVLKTIDVSNNSFSLAEKKQIEQIERFHFPQAAKARLGYELIEHLSQTVDPALEKKTIHVGGVAIEIVDGQKLRHPIFVHATKMASIPTILGNLGKFYADNVKFSTSLFETGKRFFHCNDPEPDKPDDVFSHGDYYAALGVCIDPKNFYRNYPEDVGSPTYNKDPLIATKGGNDLFRVESHVKMNKVLGLMGVYVQDLQQRVYKHLNHPTSAYSETDRLYRLEFDRQKDVDEESQTEETNLRVTTGHASSILQTMNGMYNGSVLYNIRDQIKELVHRSSLATFTDELLKKEIREVDQLVTDFYNEHDRLQQFYFGGFFKRLEFMLLILIGPLFSLFDSLRKWFLPYHLANFHYHRMVRFLGPTEALHMTSHFSYNEFEAYSHDWGREMGARPLKVSSVVISQSALRKVQASQEADVIANFVRFAQAAKAQNLPILVVSTNEQ